MSKQNQSQQNFKRQFEIFFKQGQQLPHNQYQQQHQMMSQLQQQQQQLQLQNNSGNGHNENNGNFFKRVNSSWQNSNLFQFTIDTMIEIFTFLICLIFFSNFNWKLFEKEFRFKNTY